MLGTFNVNCFLGFPDDHDECHWSLLEFWIIRLSDGSLCCYMMSLHLSISILVLWTLELWLWCQMICVTAGSGEPENEAPDTWLQKVSLCSDSVAFLFCFFFPLLSAVVQSKVWGHDFGGGIQTGRNSGKRSLVAPEDHRDHRNPQRWPKEFQRVLEATALCMASFTRDSELRYYCLLLVMLLFVTMFALNAEMCMLRFAEYRHNRGAEFFDEQSQFQGCLPVVFGICFGLLAFGFSVLCFPVLSF